MGDNTSESFVVHMSSIHYDKLARDKASEIICQAGKQLVTEIMPPEAMQNALNHKLQEEVQEYIESDTAAEMVDILEMLHWIAFNKGIRWDEVESIRIHKRDERVGFEIGIRLLEVKDREVSECQP